MRKKLILLFGGLVLALIVGEVTARNFLTAEKFVTDPILEWKGNKKFGHDANGFRNVEVPKTADIIAIGDSQTYGENARREESWPYRLGAYQMAFGGYGPTEYSVLFDHALAMQPKTVIIGFFSGNDLRDTVDDIYFDEYWKDMRRGDFAVNWDQGPVIDPDANLILQYGAEKNSLKLAFIKAKNWVYKNSKLYIFIGKSTRAIREKLNLADTPAQRDEKAFQWAKKHPEAGIAFEQGRISTILAPKLRADTVDLDNPNTQEGFRITKELLTSIQNRAEGKTDLYFVYIPTKEFVYSHISDDEDLKTFYTTENKLRSAFLQFCDSIQATCIDATVDLVQALKSDVSIVSLGTDGHYNAGGYQVIAQTIQNELSQ